MHQIYYMDATHPIWQLPQVLQAPGQRDSKLSGSGTALAGLESTLRRSWPAAQNAGKKAPFSPLSSLLPLDRRTIGSLLSTGEEALLVLLSSIHQEKILCWNQNILQNPADFARISLKKVRKTKRSSSVKTFFMFEMQHNCLFLLFQNYFNFNFLSILH